MVYLLAFLIMSLVVLGMAIGAIAGRGPLKGSCGGLAAAGIGGECEICGGDPARCEREGKDPRTPGTASYYDASRGSGEPRQR